MAVECITRDNELHVQLSGRFTFDDHVAFRVVLEAMESPGIQRVLFDMRSVAFLDSAALGMLLLAREKGEQRGLKLVLDRPSGAARKVLEMAQFDKLFTLQAA